MPKVCAQGSAEPNSPAQQVAPTWTYRSLATHWDVNEWTVRRWVRQGRLKVIRLGEHTVRITDAERLRFEQEAAA
jgi:transposase-like protein